MTNSFVFVESNSDLNYLKTLDKNLKFISFDIVAHNNLQNLGVNHNLIENYFEDDDPNTIDAKTIEICFNWYKQKEILKFLEYENINLGWLLEIELFSYIVQILKKFVGLCRFIEKENPTMIISSLSLVTMFKEIFDNQEIQFKIIPTNSKSLLHFDNIEIPINIGSKLIPIRITRKTALKFKKISEFFTNIFFNLKIDINKISDKENLLFLDFNPILYERMFNELSKTKFNILLLNERRPAAWNLSSIKIIKKNGCKLIFLQDFINKKVKANIKQEQSIFNIKLQELFSNEVFFTNYFSILGFSFWSSIKEDFITTCTTRFLESIQRLILSKQLFSILKIHTIIPMYDTGVEEKIILLQSTFKNIPSVMLQHGYHPSGEYVRKYLPITPILPSFKLNYAIWGNHTKSLLCDLEFPKKFINVVGSPRHDIFFNTSNLKNNKNTIIFADSFSSEIDFLGFDTRNFINNETNLKKILAFVNELSDHKLIVKLHPGQHALPYSIKSLIQSIDSSIPIYQSGNILELLKDCKLLIASELTTAVLEAMILKIPTMIYLSHPKWNIDETIFKNNASIQINTFEQFQSEINKLLNDVNYRNEIINNGTNFINEYFSNPGKSSKSFVELFQNLK